MMRPALTCPVLSLSNSTAEIILLQNLVYLLSALLESAGLTSSNDEPAFTIRAIVTGLFIGVLVNLTNIYYGLQVGAGSSMSKVSTLLRFAMFKLYKSPCSVNENVLLLGLCQ